MKDASQPTTSGDSGGQQIDLGISALVNGAAAAVQESPNGTHAGKTDPENHAGESQSPAFIAPETPQTEYERLAGQSSWHDLAHHCEQVIAAASGGDPEAKLWWIRSQLRLNAVPASILVAPLDSASQSILDSCRGAAADKDDSLRRMSLAASVLREVGTLLKNNMETSMALLLLERAWQIDPSDAEPLLEVVNAELKSMQTQVLRREDPQYQQALSRLKALKKEISRDNPGVVARRPAAGLSGDEDITRAHNRVRVMVLSILLLLATAVTAVLYIANLPVSETLLSALEALSTGPAGSERAVLRRPELDRIGGLGELDAVYYELREPKESSPRESGSGSNETVAAVQPGRKEVVNTSGPLLTEADKYDSKIRPAGATDKRRSYSSDMQRAAAPSGRTSSGGSPVAFENFKKARDFTVTAPTQVMSKPSHFSVPLDELRAGDKVHTEARVGPWLRLRSKQGRVGYISVDKVDFHNETTARR